MPRVGGAGAGGVGVSDNLAWIVTDDEGKFAGAYALGRYQDARAWVSSRYVGSYMIDLWDLEANEWAGLETQLAYQEAHRERSVGLAEQSQQNGAGPRAGGGMARAYERGLRLGYIRAVRDMAAAGKRLLDDLKASVDQDAAVSDERAP